MKRSVNDAKRRIKLLTKIIVFIRFKCVDVRNNEIDSYIQLVSNLMIAKQLFVDDDIIEKSSNNVKKAEKNDEENNFDDKERDKNVSRNRFARFDDVSKNNQNQQFFDSQRNRRNERKNKTRNRNFASFKLNVKICFSCNEKNHIVIDFECKNYAQIMKRRNRRQQQSRKEKI